MNGRSSTDELGMVRRPRELATFDEFMAAFRAQPNFAFCKINHGFWEVMADTFAAFGRPVPPERREDARRMSHGHIIDGYAEEFLDLLSATADKADPAFHIGLELAAWMDDDRIMGTPFRPERSVPLLNEYAARFDRLADGLLFKRAIADGRFPEFFAELHDHHVLLVGPSYIEPLCRVRGLGDTDFLPIHPTDAQGHRHEIEAQIVAWLDDHPTATVLLQAATMAPYWIMRLRDRYPRVRFVDGGLAFSIAFPQDILRRPWGLVHREGIIRTYQALTGDDSIPIDDTFWPVANVVARAREQFGLRSPMATRHVTGPAHGAVAPLTGPGATLWRDGQSVDTRPGPCWTALAEAYSVYTNRRVLPVQTLHDAFRLAATAMSDGATWRWAVPALGYTGPRTGLFSDATEVPVDKRGLLDVSALDPDAIDAVVVSLPFDVTVDLSAHIRWCAHHGKPLLLDHPAGLDGPRAAVDWQVLGLSPWVPHGITGGALLLTPADALPVDPEGPWLSEFACAAQLDHLIHAPSWVPLYRMQAARLQAIAGDVGLELYGLAQALTPVTAPSGSVTFLLHEPPAPEVRSTLPFQIASVPAGTTADPEFVRRLLRVPANPELKRLTRTELGNALRRLAGAH